MMDNLFDYYKVSVLGFDVVFAEKDESSGYKTLEKIGQDQLRGDATFNQALEKIRPSLDYDQMFANSIKGRKIVMGYYFQLGAGKPGGSGMLPKPVFPAGTFDPDHTFVVGHSYGANLPVLQQNAFSAGISTRMSIQTVSHAASPWWRNSKAMVHCTNPYLWGWRVLISGRIKWKRILFQTAMISPVWKVSRSVTNNSGG